MFVQKISGRHDLPRLAIAALGNVDLQPCFLYRVKFTVRGSQSFDRRNRLARYS